MSDLKNSTNNENFQDALAKAAANSLDKSVETLDDLSSYRIKQIRQKALTDAPIKSISFEFNKRWVVAACIMIAIGMPSFLMLNSFKTSQMETEENVFFSQEPALDAQDFDDMDMLIAMDETDA